jgi:SNF2 family DNA or RNA helicase
MEVIYKSGWFYCHDAFTFKDKLNADGFLYQSRDKSWSTRDWFKAAKYYEYFTSETKTFFNSVTLQRDHYDPKKFKTFNYITDKLDKVQKEGVLFALTRNHAYLAFEAGVGKTATALVYDFIDRSESKTQNPSLYIVPPNLISNWLNEFKMWRPGVVPVVIRKATDFYLLHEPYPVEAFIVADSLFNIDKAFGFRFISDSLKSKRFRNVIVDESHRFINFEADRTRELFGSDLKPGGGIVHQGDKVLLLSGTHMRRGPVNLYPALYALAWNLIGNMYFRQYGIRYCNGYQKRIGPRYVWDFSGSSREAELNKRIYNTFILEKTLTESRPELIGKKIERLITLDYDKTKKITKLENSLLGSGSFSDFVPTKDISKLSAYRRELAKDKVKIAFDYISSQLDGKPSAIFCVHHETIDLVLSMFKKYRPKEISGRVKPKEREKIEKDFQAGRLKLIVWQVQTAYGRNAQAGSRCFFIESPWSPDEIEQAVNRFYRRGQKNIVVADHLVLANTLDSYVLKKCLGKKETINNVKKGVSI